MYRGRYEKTAPPGYRGVAFADLERESASEDQKSTPTPLEKNGAGEEPQKESFFHPHPPRHEASTDRRNEVKRVPRDFSGTGDAPPTETSAKESDLQTLLASLLEKRFSLEEFLLMGVALVLALKDKDSEDLPLWAVALMLLGRN